MRKIKKIIAASLMLTACASFMTGCVVRAYSNKLECCGTITRYSNGKLAVSGCDYFYCTTSTGRWCKITGGYSFWTTDDAYSATGQLNGDVMTIVF